MNVWFGKSWGAPMCADLEHVPTPAGETCQWCTEAIEADASGWGSTRHGPWMHLECFMRMMLGSVGHQLGVCSCHGGAYEDSPEMSTRDAARAAWENFCAVKE
jgi:hypothetical protein